MDKDYFYLQDKPRRQAMLKEAIAVNSRTLPMSGTIANYCVREVGNSFPSGHTQFAVPFALIVSFYSFSVGFTALPVVMGTWAVLLRLHRALLSLHCPQDVLASSVLVGLVAMLAVYLVQRFSPLLLKCLPGLSQAG